MSALAEDAGALVRLRTRIFSRLLLARFTPEAQRAAPFRLAALLVLGGGALLLFGLTIGRVLAFAFHGQSARPLLIPALLWSPSAATVGIFFYAVLSLAATFTYRNDLSLLMLTPASPRLVLADKLLAVSGSFSVLMLIVGMPDVIGAGRALHAGLAFDLTAAIMVLVLPIPAASLSMLLTIGVLRLFPPSRARSGSAIVGTFAAALLYTATQLFGDVVVSTHWGTWSLLPTIWPGRALVAAADGHSGSAAGYVLGFILLAAALAFLAIDRAAYLLASGWTAYGEIARRRPRRRSYVLRHVGGRRIWRHAPAWWPAARKEWITLRRDSKLLAQLAYPLLIEGFSFYHLLGNPFTAHPISGRLARYFAASLYLSSSMTALFLLSVLALPIISREGRSLYLLGLLPARASDLLAAKILFCVTPVVALFEVLLVLVAARLLRMTMQEEFFVGAVLAALVIALGSWLVYVGLAWPRLAADGSRRQVHGTALLVGPTSGGMLCALVGFLLAAVFTTHPSSPWTHAVAGGSIFVLSGSIVAVVFISGPRLLRALLTGDRRPI